METLSDVKRFLSLTVFLLVSSFQASAEQRVSFVTAADLDGALGTASCRNGSDPSLSVANLAAAVATAADDASADDRTLLAKIHLGDLAGPSALGRFLVRQPDGPARFASIAAQLGFTSVVAGNMWFDTGAGRNAALAAALAEHDVSMLSSNVTCANRPDCDALGKMEHPLMTDAGVAFVGVIGDDVFPTIDPKERTGLEQTPVEKALAVRAASARDAGAKVVVALVHVSAEATLAPVVRLAQSVRGVDLVVVNAVSDAPQALSIIESPKGATLVVVGHAPYAATRIDFDIDDAHKVSAVRAHRVEGAPPVESLQKDVEDVRDAFCRAFDVPLTDTLSGEVSESEFLDFVLDVLRREARAEVGLLNLDALDGRGFPLRERVSRADVFSALPFEDTVVRATLSGARLKALWASPAKERLAWAGVSVRDGNLLVNERRIEDSQNYSVVMPDYVARGGAGHIGKSVSFTTVEDRQGKALELRPAVLAAMRDVKKTTESIQGAHRLDLGNSPRWTWSGALTLAANDTQLSNSARYDDARLSRSVVRALKGEAAGRLDSHTRHHAVRFTGRARYGQSRLTDGSETTVAETEDQIFGEALYRLSAIQAELDQAWYAPLPYSSVSLDSEFVRNDDAAFRRFEASATIGVRMAPIKPLELKAGAGLRRQLLDPDARVRLGLEVGYELPRFSPLSMRGLPVDVESGVDYFVSDFNGLPQHEGRFRARLLLPLGGPISFTVGFDVFAFKKGSDGFAFVSDATIGLTGRLDGGKQQF